MNPPPIDVIEHIVDFLKHDPKHLSVCALVCRSWLPRCRYHQFSNIVLHTPFHGMEHSNSRCTKFEHILSQNPSLSSYIHYLTLAGLGFLGDTVRWTDGETLRCGQIASVRSLTLARFEFRLLTDLLPVISSLPLLDELSLDKVRVVSRSVNAKVTASGAARPHTRALKALNFCGEPIGESMLESDAAAFADALLDIGALALSTRKLESLTLLSGARFCAGWLPMLPEIGSCLRHCAVSLHETLMPSGDLTESARNQALDTYRALCACREIRSLCIQYNATSTLLSSISDGSTHVVPRISPFFLYALSDALLHTEDGKNIAPFLSLEKLSLTFIGPRDGLSPCSHAFATLAEVLCDSSRYPSFSHVSVRIDEPVYLLTRFGSGNQPTGSTGSERTERARSA